MAIALFTHTACALHDNGPLHPESPGRLQAVLHELAKPAYAVLLRREAPQASKEQIARVHDLAYIEDVFAKVPKTGYVQLDADTGVSLHSGEAALRAAGAVTAAVDEVLTGKVTKAFCAVRPPGHHAEHVKPMGFCLFNNIAIGAAQALEVHKLKRIAILDFDVHHGNGTQDWAVKHKDVLFISSHQFPLWPGTGAPEEKGPFGNIINLALPPASDGAVFREAMKKIALPAIDKYEPELIMISAGFDAHRADPLANLEWVEDDFSWITTELCVLAQKHGGGRVVSTLEGGYNLPALGSSVGSHVQALIAADA